MFQAPTTSRLLHIVRSLWQKQRLLKQPKALNPAIPTAVYTHTQPVLESASGDHLGGLYLGEGDGLTLTSVKGYPIIKLQSSLASVEINIDYISIRSTKATIYADGDVFSIDNGKQRLEAKTDSDGTQSLYFNGKKVLTE